MSETETETKQKSQRNIREKKNVCVILPLKSNDPIKINRTENEKRKIIKALLKNTKH